MAGGRHRGPGLRTVLPARDGLPAGGAAGLAAGQRAGGAGQHPVGVRMQGLRALPPDRRGPGGDHRLLRRAPDQPAHPAVRRRAAGLLRPEADPWRLAAAVRGIGHRAEQSLHMHESRDFVDMSDLNFVYTKPEEFKHKIIYYETSRGCPFQCSYCLSSVEKKVRFRDLNLVKSELLQFIEWEVPQVKFVDRTFNCKREHSMEILKFIKEYDRGKTNFHFEVTADLLTEEELDFMASAPAVSGYFPKNKTGRI